MSRLTRYSSAALGMALLAGLAIYQGEPDLTTSEQESLVGTATLDSQVEESQSDESQSDVNNEELPEKECDPSRNPEDPDFEDCEQLSQK